MAKLSIEKVATESFSNRSELDKLSILVRILKKET